MVEDDAHLKIYHVNCDAFSTLWHFDFFRGVLKKNCSLDVVNVNNGSATMRTDFRVVMKGENSDASLSSLSMLGEKRESHSYVIIDHQAERCRSRQLFKSVLSDRSRSSFEGKILVRKEADKTDAFQLNNNLLLSDLANADSKPNLEIFADDVKASHGATVGQLDPEQVFYLKTRGFSLKESKKLLIGSFAKEVLDLLPKNSLEKLYAKIL
jgi:Fe-S cluster assembly protein SufD